MILNIQTLANCDTVDALHFVSAFQKLRVNKTNEITCLFVKPKLTNVAQ